MLFRAGNTSCAATSIAIAAASEGVELTALEVRVGSRSDARGLVGMSHANGTPIYAGLFDVELDVVVAANGSTPAALIHLLKVAWDNRLLATKLTRHLAARSAESTVCRLPNGDVRRPSHRKTGSIPMVPMHVMRMPRR